MPKNDVNVTVAKLDDGKWWAICDEIAGMWQKADTIEDAIQAWKDAYAGNMSALIQGFNPETQISYNVKM